MIIPCDIHKKKWVDVVRRDVRKCGVNGEMKNDDEEGKDKSSLPHLCGINVKKIYVLNVGILFKH